MSLRDLSAYSCVDAGSLEPSRRNTAVVSNDALSYTEVAIRNLLPNVEVNHRCTPEHCVHRVGED
jgi:hypothetical protein